MEAVVSQIRHLQRRLLRPALWRQTAPLLLSVVAVGLTFTLWLRYLPHWEQLWTDVVHDRNAHLELGLGLASDLVHGRVGEVIRDIDHARTWPPLHDGALLAGSVLLGGMDVRYAVLPSLLCYPLAALFAFLTTRRLVRGGTVAGLLAATLVLVSPALRAFATDVMLEGPGAALTLMALYAAVRVAQGAAAGSTGIDSRSESTTLTADWRWLALALSGLFFLKYNYWLLVVLALVAANAPAIWHWCRAHVPRIVRFAPAELRQPLNHVTLALVIACVWARMTGRSTMNLTTFAYWGLLARLVQWYWQSTRARCGRVSRPDRHDPRLRAFINWHVVPVAIWFAWPQKLACFLWVIYPGTNVGEFPATSHWDGFTFYADAAATDYHAGPWSAIFIVGLAITAIGFALAGRLRRGAGVVIALVLIAGLLTAQHPNRKSRFLHSWLPATWLLAGVGLGAAGRLRYAAAQPIALTVGTALILAHLPALSAAPRSPEGGVRRDRPSVLALTDAYLPALAGAKRPAVLCNVPLKFLARWTYLDRYGRGQRVVTDVPADAAGFARWLSATDCAAIVLIDLPPTSPWYVPVPGCATLAAYRELLASQDVFPRRTSVAIDPALAIITVHYRSAAD